MATTQKSEHPRKRADRVRWGWKNGFILILFSFFVAAFAAFGQSPGPTGANQVLTSVYDAKTNALRTEGSGSGGGTVTSVGLSMPSEFGVSGSPVTSSGTLSVDWAQPTSIAHGGTGQTTAAAAFNALAPSTSAGGLIYGTGSNTYGNLSLGPSGQCLQSNGTTLIWGSCGSGNGFTAAGDLAGSATSQTVIGLQGRPVSASAPTTGQALEWNGTVWLPTTLSGVGTVSSVELSLPSSLFSVSGSPVTTSGTLTGTLTTQSANTVFAGPSSGSTAVAVPTFRSLVAADIPALNYQAPLSSYSAPTNEFLTGFTSPNTFTAAQPSFANLSGTATLAQLPNSLAQFTGTITAGDCAKWSSSGVLADAGAACGSGGSSITLQTNGASNASQTLLNLTAGSGISLTNTSGGNVSIAATGGGALPSYWLNNSTTGQLTILPNGYDATPLAVGPAYGVKSPGSDLFDVYTSYLSTPASFGGPTVATGASIPVGDVVTACVTLTSQVGETPCSPSTTSAATTSGDQSVNISNPVFQTGATSWKIYAAACASPGPCTGLTFQEASTNFITGAATLNLTSIATGGAAPPSSNTALAGEALGVAANGTINMPLTYSWTLGANNQPSASFTRLYSGIGAAAYDEFMSPAIAPPLAPQYTLSTTGGSIGTGYSSVTIGFTYVNGPSNNFSLGQGNYPETPVGGTTVISLSGCTAGKCSISLTPPVQNYAGAFNIYLYNGTNWILQNSAPVTNFSSNYTITSIPSSPINSGPNSNTTGGQFQTTLTAAPGVSGLACVQSSVPSYDCAPGTFIATNPMTATGDLVVGGAVNLEGVAQPTRLPIGSNGQCLTSNGTNPVWGSCTGSGGSGTLTSVGLSAPAGFSVSGSPVNTSGTISLAMPSGWASGSLLVGNGSSSVTSLGIGSAGQCLEVENSTTLYWATCGSGGSSAWSSLGNAAANLTLSNSTYNTTFDQTSAATWTWSNTTAATSSANQSSPAIVLSGNYWNGSASATDEYTIQDAPGTGTNPGTALNVFHTGTPGTAYISFFSSSAGAVFFSNCGTASCDAVGENDNTGATRFLVTGGGALDAYSVTATNTFVQAQTNFVAGSAGSHINTANSANDIAGTITISAATSASHTFSTAYSNAPVCTLTPTSNPGSLTWWVTTSTTAVTANLSASGTITFNYVCVGGPN